MFAQKLFYVKSLVAHLLQTALSTPSIPSSSATFFSAGDILLSLQSRSTLEEEGGGKKEGGERGRVERKWEEIVVSWDWMEGEREVEVQEGGRSSKTTIRTSQVPPESAGTSKSAWLRSVLEVPLALFRRSTLHFFQGDPSSLR